MLPSKLRGKNQQFPLSGAYTRHKYYEKHIGVIFQLYFVEMNVI